MKEQVPLVRKGWVRAVIFLITWLILQLGINALLYFTISRLLPGTNIERLGLYGLLAMAIVSVIANLFIVWVFRKNVDRKSFASLGFQWNSYSNHFYTGLLVAVFVLALGTLILISTGNLRYLGFEFNPANFFGYIVLMILISISEEVISRGYILSNLMDSFPKWVALIISALLFSLFHFLNPSFNVMSLLGIFTGGLLLGVNYIYTRNLWFSIAFHFAWNFLQGPVLGYQVSGIEIESTMVPSIHGASWWTGGPFGFEASLIAVLLNLALAVFLYVWYKKKQAQSKFEQAKFVITR